MINVESHGRHEFEVEIVAYETDEMDFLVLANGLPKIFLRNQKLLLSIMVLLNPAVIYGSCKPVFKNPW
jgi:hypothetical protein